MKRRNVTRIIVAWALLIALMPIGLVKTFHHHDISEAHHSEYAVTVDNVDDCPICQFVLPFFTEVDSSDVTPSVTLITTIYLCLIGTIRINVRPFFSLRAPPFCLLGGE
jgi:hypothetical protein